MCACVIDRRCGHFRGSDLADRHQHMLKGRAKLLLYTARAQKTTCTQGFYKPVFAYTSRQALRGRRSVGLMRAAEIITNIVFKYVLLKIMIL